MSIDARVRLGVFPRMGINRSIYLLIANKPELFLFRDEIPAFRYFEESSSFSDYNSRILRLRNQQE